MIMQQDILKKIKEDLRERSVKKQLQPLKKMGDSDVEWDYSYCTHPHHEGILFVISKKIVFHNQRITDSKYCVYPYDKNGNYINDFDIKNICRGRFFNELKET